MWEDFKKRFSAAGLFSKTFVKWLLVSVLIGVIGGLIGAAFDLSIAKATKLFAEYRWLLYLLPAGGLLIAAIYKLTRTEGMSTENILLAIRQGKKLNILLLPVIFVSTFVTHTLGGSAGREGAALQIGGSLGGNLGKLLRLNDQETRTAVLCGMAAVFAALFGTPVTATIFVLEVASVGILQYSGLFPCGIAAFSAFFTTQLLEIEAESYHVILQPLAAGMMLRTAVLAIGCALLSVLLCETMHAAHSLSSKYFPNSYLRAAVGGVLLIGLTLLVGTREFNGAGGAVIARAIESEEAVPYAFLLKLLFTAITIGFGFKGGEIVPTFYIGATFGCVVGPLLGIPAGMAAAIGMTATFCGAVNCPIASVILSMELFGSGNLPYYAIACFIAYMLSGYSSLYHEQKIVFSKLGRETIDTAE